MGYTLFIQGFIPSLIHIHDSSWKIVILSVYFWKISWFFPSIIGKFQYYNIWYSGFIIHYLLHRGRDFSFHEVALQSMIAAMFSFSKFSGKFHDSFHLLLKNFSIIISDTQDSLCIHYLLHRGIKLRITERAFSFLEAALQSMIAEVFSFPNFSDSFKTTSINTFFIYI